MANESQGRKSERRPDPDTLTEAQLLLNRGWSAERVAKGLDGSDVQEIRDKAVSARTIRNWISRGYLTVPNPADRWSIADAEPADVALVIGALPSFVSWTGRVAPYKAEARWMARLQVIAPTLQQHPEDVYPLAFLAWRAETLKDSDTLESIALALAHRPWEDGGAAYAGACEKLRGGFVALPGWTKLTEHLRLGHAHSVYAVSMPPR